MKWQFDLASDIGGRREQQDRAAVFAVPTVEDAHLVVLADGMGGHSDGDLAAQAVLDTAEQVLADSDAGNPRQLLEQLCQRSDQAIRKIARRDASNPASTGVFLFLAGEEAYWAHVGDSRLYHFGGDGLLSQTRDHTIGELIRDTPAGRDDVGSGGALYTCLGGQNALQPEFGASATDDCDWFMLCSDGFWNQVDADETADTLHAARAASGVADQLVRLATRRAGADGDNVSLVLVTRRQTALRRAWRSLVRSAR